MASEFVVETRADGEELLREFGEDLRLRRPSTTPDDPSRPHAKADSASSSELVRGAIIPASRKSRTVTSTLGNEYSAVCYFICKGSIDDVQFVGQISSGKQYRVVEAETFSATDGEPVLAMLRLMR